MAIIKCKMCGGDLNITEGLSVAECEYCGSKQTIPTADNEKKMTLFSRASRLLRGCEFDKAAGVFENIVAEFPEEAEAYWGLVLCKYGIEYVDDPATGKKVPTCHRSSFESVLDDVNFELACENTDAVARRLYRSEARQIEELRRAIIEVSGKEDPYDLFISYKETDEQGERTLDSVIAQDIYDAFTQEAYRVFFSRISLEDKLGVEYEPYIFAALNSANVMLVVGTDYENFDSVWVKNEWSRFLKLMTQDKNKHLIPVYKNMDPYDMPKEFVKLAAQDMGKLGAMQDLVRGVKKLSGAKKAQVEEKRETVVIQQSSGGPNVRAMIDRGNMALEDNNWNEAAEFFNRALDMDAKCSEAYLGLFLIENNSVSPKAFVALILKQNEDCEVIVLEACPEDTERMQRIVEENYVLPYYQKKENIEKLFPFDRTYESSTEARNSQLVSVKAWLEQNKNLVRAFRFADGEALDMLNDMQNGIIFGLQNRVDKARAQDEANIARIKDAYDEHLDKVEAEAKRQREEAEAQCEADYLAACEYADRVNTEHLLLDAAQRFNAPKLRDYKDSAKRAEACKQRAEKIKAERIAAQEAERKRILAEKEAERQRVLAEKEAERQRKAAEKEERRRLAAEEAERKRALARERRIEAAAKAKKIVIALCVVGVLAAAGVFLVPKAIEIAPSVIEKMEQAKVEKEEVSEAPTAKNIIAQGSAGADISWALDDNGALYIEGSGDMDGYTEKDPAPWFDKRFSVRSLEISEGVTSVGNYAFFGLPALESVTLTDTITSIDYAAFSGATSLKSIELPASLNEVGGCAFERASSLKYIKIPASVSKIGVSAFRNCRALKTVDFEVSADAKVSLTWISQSAFENCSSLKKIYIPEGVTTIGRRAFYDCPLDYVHLPNSLYKIDNAAFTGIFDNILIPPNVGVLDPVFITRTPDTIYFCGSEEMWNKAYYGSEGNPVGRANIVFLPTVASGSIGSNISWILFENGTLTISGTGRIEDYTSAADSRHPAPWFAEGIRENIRKLVINPGITYIGENAFALCENLEEARLPEGLLEIGASAFHRCEKLRIVALPSTLTAIGEKAFNWCFALVDVNLPSSLQSIGQAAFNDCNSLGSIIIPEGIEEIPDGAFSNCDRLSEVVLPSTLKSIGNEAFSYTRSLNQINIHEGVTTLNRGTFSYSNIRSIKLPASLELIANGAFQGCDSLRTVEYMGTEEQWNAVKIISRNEPLLNANIEFAVIATGTAGDNITWLLDNEGTLTFTGEGAMESNATPWKRYASEIESIVITEGITSISAYAFGGCTEMNHISIPVSVIEIGDDAFAFTSPAIEYGGTEEQWNEIQTGKKNTAILTDSNSRITFNA